MNFLNQKIKFKAYLKFLFPALVLLFSTGCFNKKEQLREEIDLSGLWKFQIDSSSFGEQEKWYLSSHQFIDTINLPGTTDIAKKGILNKDTLSTRLHRNYKYEGQAWYSKDIEIPTHWKDKEISLTIERTKFTKVWIDGKFVGSSTLLQSKQVFDLTKFLGVGRHTICISVDNSLKLTNYGTVHINTNETATNWNGMVGELKLTAKNRLNIKDIQIYPDIEKKTIEANIQISDIENLSNVEIEYKINKINNGTNSLVSFGKEALGKNTFCNINASVEKEFSTWDDYDQPMYLCTATILESGIPVDEYSVNFGLRKFEAKQTNFFINNRKTFLRGKHDGCVFPITGHPPMDTSAWRKIFRIAKTYGINHYRFHTWCPPEAAFTAADHEGIFLQIELPYWASDMDSSTKTMLMNEAKSMQKCYGNHPSLTMFSLGNEQWTNRDSLTNFIEILKSQDRRILYSYGSNVHLGSTFPTKNSDFHVTVRTPYKKDTSLYHTRLTFWYGESDQGGIINKVYPNTKINFDSAVSKINIPMVSHEIGQFQVYPDYSEIKKYTGVVSAQNLEIFRKRLEKSGMLGLNKDFQKASGSLAAICYKAEIEAALRTNGLAGFQLLDLQDYPGQGTALVGMLDAFMDSKNIITPLEWRNFCNDVVPLALFDKYCWLNTETFKAEIRVANYSNKEINSSLHLKMIDGKANVLFSQNLPYRKYAQGTLSPKQELSFDLNKIAKATQLKLEISLSNTNYKNVYPIWIYPALPESPKSNEILVTEHLDNKTLKSLEQGAKVLFFPQQSTKTSVEGMFNPEFWNFGMFQGLSKLFKKPYSPGTMGLLINTQHPIFDNFPTEYHSNWQWWSLVKNSHTINLDGTEKSFLPIVQVIDNLERNHRLGLIFECKVGKGSLLVCSSRLNKIHHFPEARQLHSSIISYMNSPKFKPTKNLSKEELVSIFQ